MLQRNEVLHISIPRMKKTLLLVLTLSGQRHVCRTHHLKLLNHIISNFLHRKDLCLLQSCRVALEYMSVNLKKNLSPPPSGLSVQMSKTWAEAQSYCREMFADLATVENEEESNRLMSILRGSSTSAWIGLRDDLTRWKWSLGNADFSTGRDFNNWRSAEPDNYNSAENCTVITDYGWWRDLECSTPYPAVCYDGEKNSWITSKCLY